MINQVITPILMMKGLYLNQQNVAEVALEEEAQVKLPRLRIEGKYRSVCIFVSFYLLQIFFVQLTFHVLTIDFTIKVVTAFYSWLILVAVWELQHFMFYELLR